MKAVGEVEFVIYKLYGVRDRSRIGVEIQIGVGVRVGIGVGIGIANGIEIRI